MSNLNWKADTELKAIVRRWHAALQVHRGDRSELSHATQIPDVYRSVAFYRLKRMLEAEGYKIFDPALARTAAVLSRIRRDREGESFGILLSQKVDFDQVKRLERIQDGDRLLRAFAHLVTHLKGEAPLLDTADVVYWWEVRKPNREFFYQFFLKEQGV